MTLLLLLLSCNLAAQTHDNLPTLVRSMNKDEDTNPVTAGVRLKNVTSGKLVSGCAVWDNNVSGSITISFSDGATVTQTSPVFFSPHNNFIMFYGVKSGTGNLDITSGGIAQSMDAAQINNASSTLDGTFQHSTYSSTPSTVSDTGTTTEVNDVAVGCAGTTGVSYWTPEYPAQFAANDNGSFLDWNTTGSIGNYTDAIDVVGQTFYVHGLLIFKPSSHVIGTNALPDGAAALNYRACVTTTGGTTTPSWSATGLPSGLTIDSTGCITGIPGASGTYTPNISDGVASATISLKINNAGSNCTPTMIGSPVSTGVGLTWTFPSAAVGDEVVIPMMAHDSASTSWQESDTVFSDSCSPSDTFTHVRGVPGNKGAGFIVYKGKLSCSGSVTVTDTPEGNGTPVVGAGMLWRNVQDVIAPASAAAAIIPGSTLNLTTSSYTLNDKNSVLIAFAGTMNNPSGSPPTINSPFTSITNATSAFAIANTAKYAPGATGSYTATAAFTGLAPNGNAGVTMFELRPSYGACNNLVRHRTQWLDQF